MSDGEDDSVMIPLGRKQSEARRTMSSSGRGRGRGHVNGNGRARENRTKSVQQNERLFSSTNESLETTSEARSQTKLSETPHEVDNEKLLQSSSLLCQDELYSADEKSLNEFLVQHPMLNMEATSQRTLQLVSNLFENVSTRAPSLPVIPKSYDDQMLRPANKQIGERDCACGNRCMALFLARWRHGPDTDLAFVCCEFLLPDERSKFLAGNGLPPRRKKCLVCSRYLCSYIYYQARADPNFKIAESRLTLQSFANSVACPAGANSNDGDPPDLVELTRAQQTLPESASPVSSQDAYSPSAMLFVDEEFFSRQASREPPLSSLMWQPIVRFASNHYKYVMADDGPVMLQVGIGADEPDFQLASVA